MITGSALCQVFQLLARRTWCDLRDGHLANIKVSEESITDFLLLDLKRACPSSVAIQKYTKHREGKTTGADWEWWLVGQGKAFGMRVQAKRLDPVSCKYEELDHTVPRRRQKQVNLLLKDARSHNLYPVYCFYNYWDKLATPPKWRCRSYAPHWDLFGCSVCDARIVKTFIGKGVKGVSDIGSESFPWMCLVCCTGFSGEKAGIAERAHGVARAMSLATTGGDAKVAATVDIPDLLDVEKLPDYVLPLLASDRGTDRVMEAPEGRFLDGVLVLQED